MANKLTERKKIKGITYTIQPHIENNLVIHKLGLLEDILEKYGIESVEELNKKIGYYIDKIDLEAENDYLKKAIEKQNIVTQSISKDRDTWKKACELACEEIDCEYMYSINKENYSQYFYQQAKTEGNDE